MTECGLGGTRGTCCIDSRGSPSDLQFLADPAATHQATARAGAASVSELHFPGLQQGLRRHPSGATRWKAPGRGVEPELSPWYRRPAPERGAARPGTWHSGRGGRWAPQRFGGSGRPGGCARCLSRPQARRTAPPRRQPDPATTAATQVWPDPTPAGSLRTALGDAKGKPAPPRAPPESCTSQPPAMALRRRGEAK